MALHLGNHDLLETEQPFRTLLSQPGVSEVLQLGSQFGFMAFHGGWLEEVTDDIASAAAERSPPEGYQPESSAVGRQDRAGDRGLEHG